MQLFFSHKDLCLAILVATVIVPSLGVSQGSMFVQLPLTRPDKSLEIASARFDISGTPKVLFNMNYGARGDSPDLQARRFLADQSQTLKIEGTADFRTEKVERVPGGWHVRLVQEFEGIPVFRGDVVVSGNQSDRITMVVNNSLSGISLSSVTPTISPQDAVSIVRNGIGITGTSIGKNDEAKLMIYRSETGVDHLAFRVTTTSESPSGDWEAFVDANDGELLNVENRFVNSSGHRVQGSGFVYLSDPISAARQRYGRPGFVDGNDSDTDSLTHYRTLVTLDSLTFEDGVYKLKGPYCTVTDIESPADPLFYSALTPDGFQYTRSQQEFEAVNVYYHVTQAYRHLLNLGFQSQALTQIRLDPHGVQGQDNSHYSPNGNWIAWGEGGVDDAEDADHIWHEYGHAIQFNFIPNWGGGESGALGEGFADYWAASYSRSLNQWSAGDFQKDWLYNWDGHNTFWLGRITNDTRTYPFGNLPIHSAGQIWSAALMGIWEDLGREITDKLVIKSMQYLGSAATAPDNAHAIIQADRDLYGGAHIGTLVHWLGTIKRFINPEIYLPRIVHTPLVDIENAEGPFAIAAQIQSLNPVIERKIVWGKNGSFSDSTTLIPTGQPFEFHASITGSPAAALYQYYLVVKNAIGVVVTDPPNAPLTFHTFQAGIDSTPPAILHEAPGKIFPSQLPFRFGASVTDNLLVDSVWIEYTLDDEIPHSFPLVRTSENHYTAEFPVSASELKSGDKVHYRLVARDGSRRHNTIYQPATGYYQILIAETMGSALLIVDDLDQSASDIQEDAASQNHRSYSSERIEAGFRNAGFSIEKVTAATAAMGFTGNYEIVVLVGGKNPHPFNSPVLRRSVINFARNGGRLLVEGENVASYYRETETSTDVDSEFRRSVLLDFASVEEDSEGLLTPIRPMHPLYSQPHPLSPAIEFDRGRLSSKERAVSLRPGNANRTVVAGWNGQSDLGGILVQDDMMNSKAPRIVFFTFNVASIEDSAMALQLVANAARYLGTSTIPVTTLPQSPEEEPLSFSLQQNFPNPFNPSTTIRFSLPTTGNALLRIVDMLGRVVAQLNIGELPAGTHSIAWDGRSNDGLSVASGIYLYRLEYRAGQGGDIRVLQNKMVLVK